LEKVRRENVRNKGKENEVKTRKNKLERWKKGKKKKVHTLSHQLT
jgi:hypothetical protein